jgi:DNA invertase Pin-like site-specific DNA recombinase
LVKLKRVGIYLRVSRAEQKTSNQRIELERLAEQRGWTVTDIYDDHGISGAKGRDKRPEFNRLCVDASRGKLDVIAAWSIDRLGRSLATVVTFLADMQEQNVAVYLHQQQVDGTTSAGRAMLAMCSVFAQFERDITIERIHAGLKRARAQGTRLGRPPVDHRVEADIRRLRARGRGMLSIAKELKIGTGTVQRVCGTSQ